MTCRCNLNGRPRTRTAQVDGQLVDLRVSTIPIARRGEKVVIRILDRTLRRGSTTDLGLPTHEHDLLQRLLGPGANRSGAGHNADLPHRRHGGEGA